MRAYYGDRHVRNRITEFLGGRELPDVTCLYLQRCDGDILSLHPQPPSSLPDFLANGLEISRSLWDREALVAHLDIEYVNADFPAEALLDPARAFALQAPAIAVVEEILTEAGIAPLHLVSPRGHHFVWRVPNQSRAYRALVDLGRVPPDVEAGFSAPQAPDGTPVTRVQGLANAGLALVLEYLAHLVITRASPASPLPVTLTDVAVGTGERGRESISLDLSEYGDPLHTRVIRAPFSVYLKPWLKPGMFHDGSPRPPLMVMIPQHELDTGSALAVRTDLAAAARLARRTRTAIPAMAEGTEHLVAWYRESDLARFHDWFYAEAHEPRERWPHAYDDADLDGLPPCVARRLAHPNDALLRPAGIQALVRALWGHGWHPRHIAGLLRSRYERDHGWGPRWVRYDAALRADFYTRVFAGLVATGRDELIDFNCISEQEKSNCPLPHMGCDLTGLRHRARQRSWP